MTYWDTSEKCVSNICTWSKWRKTAVTPAIRSLRIIQYSQDSTHLEYPALREQRSLSSKDRKGKPRAVEWKTREFQQSVNNHQAFGSYICGLSQWRWAAGDSPCKHAGVSRSGTSLTHHNSTCPFWFSFKKNSKHIPPRFIPFLSRFHVEAILSMVYDDTMHTEWIVIIITGITMFTFWGSPSSIPSVLAHRPN